MVHPQSNTGSAAPIKQLPPHLSHLSNFRRVTLAQAKADPEAGEIFVNTKGSVGIISSEKSALMFCTRTNCCRATERAIQEWGQVRNCSAHQRPRRKRLAAKTEASLRRAPALSAPALTASNL